jgi:hypothetical protein
MLASSIIDLVLATTIVSGLPATAAWTLGLLVGLNLVFGGAQGLGAADRDHNGTPAKDEYRRRHHRHQGIRLQGWTRLAAAGEVVGSASDCSWPGIV